jgi:hypothetical protein
MDEESMGMTEIIEHWDDDGSTNHHNSTATVVSRIAIMSFWILVVLFNGYFAWLIYKGHRRRNRRLQEGTENHQTNAHIIAEKLASMTTDAKLTYYNKLFDKHGNQIELTNDQIIVSAVATTETTTKRDKSSWDAGKDDIETGTRGDAFVPQHQCNNDHDDDGSDNDNAATTIAADAEVYLSLATIHPCGKPDACESRKGNSEKSLSHLDGECVICLEFFQAGNTIVYNIYTCPNPDNDNNSPIPIETTGRGCSHVYHKTCLVQYLANRKISAKGLRDGMVDTLSCPTCRQPYSELLSIVSVVNDNKNDCDSDNCSSNVNEEGDDSDIDFEPQLDVHG